MMVGCVCRAKMKAWVIDGSDEGYCLCDVIDRSSHFVVWSKCPLQSKRRRAGQSQSIGPANQKWLPPLCKWPVPSLTSVSLRVSSHRVFGACIGGRLVDYTRNTHPIHAQKTLWTYPNNSIFFPPPPNHLSTPCVPSGWTEDTTGFLAVSVVLGSWATDT